MASTIIFLLRRKTAIIPKFLLFDGAQGGFRFQPPTWIFGAPAQTQQSKEPNQGPNPKNNSYLQFQSRLTKAAYGSRRRFCRRLFKAPAIWMHGQITSRTQYLLKPCLQRVRQRSSGFGSKVIITSGLCSARNWFDNWNTMATTLKSSLSDFTISHTKNSACPKGKWPGAFDQATPVLPVGMKDRSIKYSSSPHTTDPCELSTTFAAMVTYFRYFTLFRYERLLLRCPAKLLSWSSRHDDLPLFFTLFSFQEIFI